MKIAQVAPLPLPVPPKKYGGMERMISYLTEEIMSQGHEVTLFARGGSKTRARLISPPTNGGENTTDFNLDQAVMMSQLSRRVSEFDVIHVHPISIHWLPFLRLLNAPYLITQHNIIRADAVEVERAVREFSDAPLVSISDAQREPVPWMNWRATVHYGLPLDLYKLQEKAGEYLAFIGRITPVKGVSDAIEIAKRSGRKLKIAGQPITKEDSQYFESKILPFLKGPMFEYVGELNDSEKQSFFEDACALLCPVKYREAFGLVMIEALACGTPVIGYGLGSIPEVVDDGVTGFVVRGVEEAVDAVSRIHLLSRKRCRQEVDQRFSAGRMCAQYLQMFEKLAFTE